GRLAGGLYVGFDAQDPLADLPVVTGLETAEPTIHPDSIVARKHARRTDDGGAGNRCSAGRDRGGRAGDRRLRQVGVGPSPAVAGVGAPIESGPAARRPPRAPVE